MAGNGKLPAPQGDHEIRTATPAAAWQTAPPGPPGAAIEPPPCSTSGVPFQTMATSPEEAPSYAPPPPPDFFAFHTCMPDLKKWVYGPFDPPLFQADPNTAIGQETSPEVLQQMWDESHNAANNKVR